MQDSTKKELSNMNNDILLGRLISEHPSDGSSGTKLGAIKRLAGGCLGLLLLPVAAGVCGISEALTNTAKTQTEREGLYFSVVALVVGSVLIALLVVMLRRAPEWLEQRERLEIYENGFVVRQPVYKPVTCLWQDVQSVDPVSLGDYIPKTGDEIIAYKIQKKDGSKLYVSRNYQGIERFEEISQRFRREVPG